MSYYAAIRQPGFWEMLAEQLPHLTMTLITWPVFSMVGQSAGERLASMALARGMPWLAKAAPHITSGIPLVGSSLATTLVQSLWTSPMAQHRLERELAMQRLLEMRQRRQRLIGSLLQASIDGQTGTILGG